jgi:hypothetical protein
MRKLLFLDFDGVLHNTTSSEGLLFEKLNLLSDVLLEIPCPVVISSSWRFHHELNMLKSYLKPISKLIVGTTGDPFIGRFPRYHEIKAYLNLQAPFADWRALDDSFLEFPKLCPELILCKAKTGITQNEMNILTEWLKK